MDPSTARRPHSKGWSLVQDLRVVRAEALSEYLHHTRIWLEAGNAGLAAVIASPEGGKRSRSEPEINLGTDKPYVLYHARSVGFLGVTADQAVSIQALRTIGIQPSGLSPEERQLVGLLSSRGWCAPQNYDLKNVVDVAMMQFIAIQNPHELLQFLSLIRTRRLETLVEIGTARGGMFYCLSQVADPNALLISIDLAGGPNGGGQTALERELFQTFAAANQRCRFVAGDSHDDAVLAEVRELTEPNGIDLLFVDGDHAYRSVRSDIERFGALVRPGGLIALHDIALTEEWGVSSGAGRLWREVKGKSLGYEFVDGYGSLDPADNGLHAWGIGVVESSSLLGALRRRLQ